MTAPAQAAAQNATFVQYTSFANRTHHPTTPPGAVPVQTLCFADKHWHGYGKLDHAPSGQRRRPLGRTVTVTHDAIADTDLRSMADVETCAR